MPIWVFFSWLHSVSSQRLFHLLWKRVIICIYSKKYFEYLGCSRLWNNYQGFSQGWVLTLQTINIIKLWYWILSFQCCNSPKHFVSASIIFIHAFNFYSQVFYLPIDWKCSLRKLMANIWVFLFFSLWTYCNF